MRRIIATIILIALTAAACGDDDSTSTTAGVNSYSNAAGGLAFSYPGGWSEIPGLQVTTQVGPTGALAFVAVGALDPTSGNLIGASVQVDELTVVVAADDERLFLESQFDPVMTEVAVRAGGTIGVPQWTTIAGHDARAYVITSEVRGQDLTSRMTAFVIGGRFYKTLCQAPPDSFDATVSGCDLVTATLDIG
jgi:hypothetical protein